METQLIKQTVQQVNEQQNQPCDASSSSSSDQIDHYADDTPLPKSIPMELKFLWLNETNKSLQKFTVKFEEYKKSQKDLQAGFKLFRENENKYRLSSVRKIELKLDHKKLYEEYLQKTRKTIEKLDPTLIINIISYTHEHLFLGLLNMRRVSKIFDQIYLSQPIQVYLAHKDYLYSGAHNMAIKNSIILCKKYVKFYKTFLYYKQMQYSEQIPQNSITKDLQESVSFINQIHRLVFDKNSRDFGYYEMMNQFMKRNRVVIGLSSLSLTSLVLVRKTAIIAFSNYLAFNQHQRSKEQITKTKYSKVISVVEYEDYRDSLILNTKVSNYLWEDFRHNFAVLVTPNMSKVVDIKVQTWNILIYHLHNEDKAYYLQNIQLDDGKYSSTKLDVEFYNNMTICSFATIEYCNWVKAESIGKYMQILTSPLAQNQNIQGQQQFSYCHFYRFQQYYIVAIPVLFA